jgi:hypothetical protein
MLTVENSALVAGQVPAASHATRRVVVVRAFLWRGEPTVVGDVLELPRAFAAQVIGSGKAGPATDTPPASEGSAQPPAATKAAAGGRRGARAAAPVAAPAPPPSTETNAAGESPAA